MHLETALRGVIIGERWPKSGVEVVVTVLEGDEDGWWGDAGQDNASGANGGAWGLLNVLAGCITVASAAIVDAGIDVVDMVSGGVAAIVRDPSARNGKDGLVTLLDPCPAEHQEIVAACAVGYLTNRDEITEIWMKGDVGTDSDGLVEGATHAAVGSVGVLKDVLLEAMSASLKSQAATSTREGTKRKQQDAEMSG